MQYMLLEDLNFILTNLIIAGGIVMEVLILKLHQNGLNAKISAISSHGFCTILRSVPQSRLLSKEPAIGEQAQPIAFETSKLRLSHASAFDLMNDCQATDIFN